jgi:uncharacterized protein (DUF1697 family)
LANTTTFIALLRGINVGGNRKLAMAELRDLCTEAGLTDVRTYVNSGSLVFAASGDAPAQETLIESAIEAHFGFKVDVIVRSAGEWSAYVRSNPFPELAQKHPNFVMLMVPKTPLGRDAVERLRARIAGDERVEAVGDVLWIYFAQGAGRSKLAAASPTKVPVTTRNWRTVVALEQMAKAAASG